MKRFYGSLCLGVGVVGVILAVICMVISWRAAAVMAEQAMNTSEVVVAISNEAYQTVDRADTVLDNIQQRVEVLKSAEAISAGRDGSPDDTQLVRNLDANFLQALDETRNILLSVQSGVNALNQTVGLFDSLSSPMRVEAASCPQQPNW